MHRATFRNSNFIAYSNSSWREPDAPTGLEFKILPASGSNWRKPFVRLQIGPHHSEMAPSRERRDYQGLVGTQYAVPTVLMLFRSFLVIDKIQNTKLDEFRVLYFVFCRVTKHDQTTKKWVNFVSISCFAVWQNNEIKLKTQITVPYCVRVCAKSNPLDFFCSPHDYITEQFCVWCMLYVHEDLLNIDCVLTPFRDYSLLYGY